MPRPTGPQWDAFGPEPVKSQALGIINKTADDATSEWGSGVIHNPDAKKVMRAANIRQWDLSDHASSIREGWTEGEDIVWDHEPLNTTQQHLHAPTLRRYMTVGPPEMDPEDSEREYHPEVLRTENDTPWIDEGHHRIIASRLLGERNLRVYTGPLMKSVRPGTYHPKRYD